MRKLLLISTFCLLALSTIAQKKPSISTLEEVKTIAFAQLDEDVAQGDLKEYAKELSIKGNYTFDITVRKKGEVSTVFAVKRDGSVNGQNQLKDYLKDYKFKFKLPKGKSYKFQYTITVS